MTTHVVAVFTAKQGKDEELKGMFESVVPTTHHEDKGCISYQLNRDQDNPRRFVFTEEWESRALLEEHLNKKHITDLFAKVPDYVDAQDVMILDKVAGGKV